MTIDIEMFGQFGPLPFGALGLARLFEGNMTRQPQFADGTTSREQIVLDRVPGGKIGLYAARRGGVELAP